jgi:hypothetical protein
MTTTQTPHQREAHFVADAVREATFREVQDDFRTNTFFFEGEEPGKRVRVVVTVEDGQVPA